MGATWDTVDTYIPTPITPVNTNTFFTSTSLVLLLSLISCLTTIYLSIRALFENGGEEFIALAVGTPIDLARRHEVPCYDRRHHLIGARLGCALRQVQSCYGSS